MPGPAKPNIKWVAGEPITEGKLNAMADLAAMTTLGQNCITTGGKTYFRSRRRRPLIRVAVTTTNHAKGATEDVQLIDPTDGETEIGSPIPAKNLIKEIKSGNVIYITRPAGATVDHVIAGDPCASDPSAE